MLEIQSLSSLHFEESHRAMSRLGDLQVGQFLLSAPTNGEAIQINAERIDEMAKLRVTIDQDKIAVQRVDPELQRPLPLQVEIRPAAESDNQAPFSMLDRPASYLEFHRDPNNIIGWLAVVGSKDAQPVQVNEAGIQLFASTLARHGFKAQHKSKKA